MRPDGHAALLWQSVGAHQDLSGLRLAGGSSQTCASGWLLRPFTFALQHLCWEPLWSRRHDGRPQCWWMPRVRLGVSRAAWYPDLASVRVTSLQSRAMCRLGRQHSLTPTACFQGAYLCVRKPQVLSDTLMNVGQCLQLQLQRFYS